MYIGVLVLLAAIAGYFLTQNKVQQAVKVEEKAIEKKELTEEEKRERDQNRSAELQKL